MSVKTIHFFSQRKGHTGSSLVFVNKFSKFATITARETRAGKRKHTNNTQKDEDLFH